MLLKCWKYRKSHLKQCFRQNIKWKHHKIESLILIKIQLPAAVNVWVVYPAADVLFLKICMWSFEAAVARLVALCCFGVRRRPTCLAFTRGAILCWLHGCAFSRRNPTRLPKLCYKKKDSWLQQSTVTSVMPDVTCCYLYFSISWRAKSTVVTLSTHFWRKKWHRWEENYTSLTPHHPPTPCG